MNITVLFADLIRQGVHLKSDNDNLIIGAPKGTLTPAQKDLLAQHKPEILALMRDYSSGPTLFCPLSIGQKGLWFLYRLVPESSAYNMMIVIRICSTLAMPALKYSFQKLIRRHQCLRATYAEIGGEPVQIVHEETEVHFEVINALAWSAEELEICIEKMADRPFELERGPVLRISLFPKSAMEHILLLTVHHIAFDLRSLEILISELRELYTAEARGGQSTLSPLPLQYSDYIRWCGELVTGPRGKELGAYWENQLAGELPFLNLTSDRPRPPVQTYEGMTYSFELSDDLIRCLKELSKNEGVSLYMVFLAAFQVLLYRYTGQEDILVGSPTSGRSRQDFERMIGYFVNMVVMRADLSGEPTFKEFLSRMRRTVVEALKNAEYPFPLLVQRLQPTRDPSRSPLFQVAFVWDQPHQTEDQRETLNELHETETTFDSSVLELEFIRGSQRGAEFDLILTIVDNPNSLSALFRFNRDLFDRSTIARMAGHFQTLLEGIADYPGQSLSNLPLLRDAERHQLLVECNATKREYPADKTLVHLFEEQTGRTPEAVAVVYEGSELTYGELNSRANQLAHHLIALGVGPEVLVGLYMERSLEMVIGIYGIIKAGGAYVPLDPAYPPDRIAFMMEDTKIPVLLTEQSLVFSLPEHRTKVICLDSDWGLINKQSEGNPIGGATPENLAYVIYTSGSTGQPKGVMNEHRGIVNRLIWMQEEYQLTSADRILQKTPFSFDVSVWEFFWPLQVGASLILAKPGGHRDCSYLTKIIIDQKITTLHFVPSMLRIFLEEDDVEQCTSIKRIICSGEVLPFDLKKIFFEKFDTELHNLYGPTEAAVDVTHWACRPDSDPVVPIGYPVANTQIYILDPKLNPVPIGCTGELYIGGIQVARGYLNRPELTAEKFIPDPFQDSPHSRLYKTGDLARYLSDGSIEYLGRIDFQVKIRGLRVELAEIEARMADLDAVNKCVVIVREDRPGDQRLVAYYVLKPGFDFSVSDWRSYLHSKLPDYMVPQFFVELESIPITSNGKVDRKALPKPEVDNALEQGYVAPRTDTERKIAGIWQDVLDREKVGVHDNFFELGGHSLLATQLISRIGGAFNIELSLRSLFENPTVADVAEAIARRQIEQADHETVARILAELEQLSPDEVRTRLALDPEQEEN